jgi:hypothetical protein
LRLPARFGDDGQEPVGVEEARRLGERAAGGAGDAEWLPDLLQAAGPAEGAEGARQGAEEGKGDEGAVVVEREGAVAGAVAAAAVAAQARRQRRPPAEVLLAVEIAFPDGVRLRRLPAAGMRGTGRMRKCKIRKIVKL